MLVGQCLEDADLTLEVLKELVREDGARNGLDCDRLSGLLQSTITRLII